MTRSRKLSAAGLTGPRLNTHICQKDVFERQKNQWPSDPFHLIILLLSFYGGHLWNFLTLEKAIKVNRLMQNECVRFIQGGPFVRRIIFAIFVNSHINIIFIKPRHSLSADVNTFSFVWINCNFIAMVGVTLTMNAVWFTICAWRNTGVPNKL